MNLCVLSWLLFFLAPGGCPIYSINVSTLEVSTNDFQNELTLHSMLSSELQQYRNGLNDVAISPAKEDWLTEWQRELPKVARSAVEAGTFLGTNLFDGHRKKCFSLEEMALMSARRTFEQLVPKSYPKCMLSDSVVHMLIRFVNTVNQIVQQMSDEDTRRLPQRAFYDALGGYLRYYLVPAAQVSYYAGRLKLTTVQRLVSIKRQAYVALNTNGNGWRTPAKDIMGQFKGAKIKPVELAGEAIKFEDGAFSCAQLDQNCVDRDADQGQMIVSLPQLEPVDSEGHLSNIYLPFHQRRIYNLRSASSACVLVRFFQTLTSCHRFQGMSQANYNHKLLAWIRENVHSHYRDEMFYPGLGGILQIQESLLIQKRNREPEECKDDDNCSGLAEESRKVSRSTNHWQEVPEPGQEEKLPGEAPAEQEKVQTQLEECRECDSDDTLIWSIAAFLVLLLLLIVIVICCCMRRARKRKEKTPFVPIDVEAPPSFKPKHTKVRERPKGGDSESYYGHSIITVPESSRSQASSDEPLILIPQVADSSTSSLGCHLNRKCLPAKIAGSKGKDSYYRVISEGSSSRKFAMSTTTHQYDLDQASEVEDRDRERKRKRQRRQSPEAKRKGRKGGESGRSKAVS